MLSARWPRKRRSFVNVESIVQFAPSHASPASSGHPPSRWMISLSVLTSSPPDSPKIWRSQVTRSNLEARERHTIPCERGRNASPLRRNLTTHRCAPNRFAEIPWPIWRLQSSSRCCCHRWEVKKPETGCCHSARWRYLRRRSRLPDNSARRKLRKQSRKSYRRDQRCCQSCNTRTRQETAIRLHRLREEICLPLQDRGAGMNALGSCARFSPDRRDANEDAANYNWNCFATHVFALDRLADKEKLFWEQTWQRFVYGGRWPTWSKPGMAAVWEENLRVLWLL